MGIAATDLGEAERLKRFDDAARQLREVLQRWDDWPGGAKRNVHVEHEMVLTGDLPADFGASHRVHLDGDVAVANETNRDILDEPAEPKEDEIYPDAAERRDAVLRRLLTTKPKPRKKSPTKEGATKR